MHDFVQCRFPPHHLLEIGQLVIATLLEKWANFQLLWPQTIDLSQVRCHELSTLAKLSPLALPKRRMEFLPALDINLTFFTVYAITMNVSGEE